MRANGPPYGFTGPKAGVPHTGGCLFQARSGRFRWHPGWRRAAPGPPRQQVLRRTGPPPPATSAARARSSHGWRWPRPHARTGHRGQPDPRRDLLGLHRLRGVGKDLDDVPVDIRQHRSRQPLAPVRTVITPTTRTPGCTGFSGSAPPATGAAAPDPPRSMITSANVSRAIRSRDHASRSSSGRFVSRASSASSASQPGRPPPPAPPTPRSTTPSASPPPPTRQRPDHAAAPHAQSYVSPPAYR